MKRLTVDKIIIVMFIVTALLVIKEILKERRELQIDMIHVKYTLTLGQVWHAL